MGTGLCGVLRMIARAVLTVLAGGAVVAFGFGERMAAAALIIAVITVTAGGFRLGIWRFRRRSR